MVQQQVLGDTEQEGLPQLKKTIPTGQFEDDEGHMHQGDCERANICMCVCARAGWLRPRSADTPPPPPPPQPPAPLIHRHS